MMRERREALRLTGPQFADELRKTLAAHGLQGGEGWNASRISKWETGARGLDVGMRLLVKLTFDRLEAPTPTAPESTTDVWHQSAV